MPGTRVQITPDHNLALDLVRTTEAAALAAARWVGRGDKNEADQAAVDAMRLLFNTVPFDGLVVIGEGEKDEAPMLFNGEVLGTGSPPQRRRGGRPDRRDPAGGPRRGQRDVGGRGRPARLDVQPRALRLHGEDRHRPRRGRSPRHRGAHRGERPQRGQGSRHGNPRTSPS